MNVCSNGWSKLELELLIDCWQQGMSARDIENKIPTRSRCAILGKIMRLRNDRLIFSKPQRRGSGKNGQLVPAVIKPQVNPFAYPKPPTIIDNGLGHAIDTAIAFSQAQSMSLLEAGPEHCRWPIDGDRNPRCCGSPISRVSYCVDHARQAFTGT